MLVAQDHVHTNSEHPQAERFHNPPGQPAPAGSPSHRQNKTLSTAVKGDYEEDSSSLRKCKERYESKIIFSLALWHRIGKRHQQQVLALTWNLAPLLDLE